MTCSRYDAVRAVNKSYSASMQAFDEMAFDDSQPHESRIKAEGYLKKLKLWKSSILLEPWDAILNKFHETNQSLQKS